MVVFVGDEGDARGGMIIVGVRVAGAIVVAGAMVVGATGAVEFN